MSALGIAVAVLGNSFIACCIFHSLGNPHPRIHNRWDYAFALTLLLGLLPSLIATIILGAMRL